MAWVDVTPGGSTWVDTAIVDHVTAVYGVPYGLLLVWTYPETDADWNGISGVIDSWTDVLLYGWFLDGWFSDRFGWFGGGSELVSGPTTTWVEV